ncbi:MAG TPA: PorV/PorQ family protein [Rhodothermales bacterium]|nr:PorV/PorQ family protein [Rhodothermales bacterium]
MKRSYYTTWFFVALCLLMVPSALAQTFIPGPDEPVATEKRGQTGFKFLTTTVNARSAAMGGAITSSTVGSSLSLFENPASMARMEGDFHVAAGVVDHLVDFRYNYASAAYQPVGGAYGVVGLSLVYVDYGDFFETVRANNEQGFIELGTYSPTALGLGLGYARSFSDRFSVGAHVKYALQDLGSFAVARVSQGGTPLGDGTSGTFRDYSLNTLAVDFGVLYNTGFRSLTIAMSTRNFSREMIYERERFELPLTFQLGMSMDLIDLTSLDPNVHAFQFSVDAQRPRDFVEHLKLGAEYTVMNVLSLRGGWGQAFVGSEDSEQGLSLGGGIKYEIGGIGFGADYAYTDFGLFGQLQHIGIQFSL